jgi:SAM-dependent methyltransferase
LRGKTKNVRTPAAKRLVCPICRQPPQGWPIDSETLTCTNNDCGVVFECLPDSRIPLVVPGPREAFLQFDAPVNFESLTEISRWLDGLERGGPVWEQAVRTGMYAMAHHSSESTLFSALCERFLDNLGGDVGNAIDLGCGAGRLACEISRRLDANVIGLDSNPLILRLAAAAAESERIAVPVLTSTTVTAQWLEVGERPDRGRVRWLCADVHYPPVRAERFELVLAVNFIDSVVDPFLALGQACAMVRSGGYLLVAQPDAWNASFTDAENWIGADESEWESLLGSFGMEIIDREDGFEWELKRTSRHQFRYVLQARLARKVSSTS